MGANAGPHFSRLWSIYAELSPLLVFGLYVSMLLLLYRQNRDLFKHKVSPAPVPPSSAVSRIQTVNVADPNSNQKQHSLVQSKTQHKVDPKMKSEGNMAPPFCATVTYWQGFLTPFGAGLNLYIYLEKHAEIRKCAFILFSGLKGILQKSG